MIICHYFLPLCRITVIVYATHFKVLKVTYWCQHRHCKVLLFPYIFFWKNAIFMTTLIQILCSFICHQYLFATITHFCMIFFSSIQRHEGVGAGYWRTLPLAYQSKKKKKLQWKFWETFQWNIHFAVFYSSIFWMHADAENHLLWEARVRFKHAKESMPKKFQACAEVCACNRILYDETWSGFTFWIRDICATEWKTKIV